MDEKKKTEKTEKTDKPASLRDVETARAFRLGQRAAGQVRQRKMAEIRLEPRAVRRAVARMTRGGRKGEKALVLVARREGEKVVDAVTRASRTVAARHARAGVMPHSPKDPEKKTTDLARRDAWRAAWRQRLPSR